MDLLAPRPRTRSRLPRRRPRSRLVGLHRPRHSLQPRRRGPRPHRKPPACSPLLTLHTRQRTLSNGRGRPAAKHVSWQTAPTPVASHTWEIPSEGVAADRRSSRRVTVSRRHTRNGQSHAFRRSHASRQRLQPHAEVPAARLSATGSAAPQLDRAHGGGTADAGYSSPTQVGRVHKGSRDEEGGHHSEP